MTNVATQAFHVFDDEKFSYVTFHPGEEVPDHLAARVGDHVVDRDGTVGEVPDVAPSEPSSDTGSEGSPEALGIPAEGSLDGSDGDPAPAAADAVYDPADHNVDEVLGYLESADPAESERVRDAEKAGKNRKGIVGED